jgi:uncharacterized protein YndB with AHSA1/START domain
VKASRSRVWRALTDPGEFGAWFGVKLTGAFAPGARVRGAITSKGYEHVELDLTVDRMEPEKKLSWRWHPHAVEAGVDYSKETPTLVEFTLEDIAGGTRLTVVESGFDKVPAARRALAFRMNGEGWAIQLENIRRHVA